MSETESKLATLKNNTVMRLYGCGVSNINREKLDDCGNNLKSMLNNQDATLVWGKDSAELETIRRNFVEKKLGVTDRGKAMSAINKVADIISGIRMKSRPTFYCLVQNELS